MRGHRYSATRNKLDLRDRVQVRIVRKRLKVSEKQLVGLVQKAGDSLAAVRKEADLQRLVTEPPAVVIASVQEPAVAETAEERTAV
ncbi:DUF3606 domain-containing protein [Bradyrhizobium sp.]|uniref:DUF3606 domain-containing protein n=1 Tax=Bradyrhizobium sp. TaxID=376 RepID=UPI002634E784|nr:DUF3606 domain-containing protein [Bradyrhizobium sp.]